MRDIRDAYRADRAPTAQSAGEFEEMLKREGMTVYPGWEDMPLGRGWFTRKWRNKRRSRTQDNPIDFGTFSVL